MKGKVAAMTDTKEMTIKEFDIPSPEKGQVLLEITKANICGSDVHMWEGKHVLKDHVLGHEMVGKIVELGEGVSTDYAGEKVEIGDRIVPVYYLTCQRCEACLNGNFNLCENGSDFMGQNADLHPHFTGGFATHYFIHPNQYFYKVPDNIPDNVAAGSNCGISQIMYAMDQSNLKANDFLVIQGAGGLGLFATAIAHTMGANIIMIDGVETRLADAKRFGANYTINMNEYQSIDSRIKRVQEITGQSGANIVLEVAGIPQAFDEGLRLVGLGGTYIELGNVLVDESLNANIVPGFITRKCVTIKGILRYQPWYLHKTLKFLEKYHDKFPFNELTDRTYSLDETQISLEKAHSKEIARAVIEPNKSS